MKLTDEMIEKAKEIAKEHVYDFCYGSIGVRVQPVPFELGPIDHVSHVWIDGEETDEELDGICACAIDDLKHVNAYNEYFGDHVAVIGGNLEGFGEDEGEIILSDAEVIAILK